MSDADTVRKKRLAALEEKKARLEKLRADRESRHKDQSNTTTKATTTSSSNSASNSTQRADVDALVDSLLGGAKLSESSSSNSLHNKSDDGSGDINQTNNDIDSSSSSDMNSNKNKVELSTVTSVLKLHLPPKSIEVYEKESQTDEDLFPSSSDHLEIDSMLEGVNIGGPRSRESNSNRDRDRESPSNRRVSSRGGSIGTLSRPGSPRNIDDDDTNIISTTLPPPPPPTTLTDDEINTLTESDTFKSFLRSSSHTMSKLLGISDLISGGGIGGSNEHTQPIESLSTLAFKDYAADTGHEKDEAILSTRGCFEDTEGWLAHRPIFDIQPSSHHPELFCVAYGASKGDSDNSGGGGGGGNNSSTNIAGMLNMNTSTSTTVHSSAGAVGLWTLVSRSSPEYRLAAPAPVLSACFHPYDSRVILAGCSDGSICIWDLSAFPSGAGAASSSSSIGYEPTIRSSVSGRGHKYPIKGLHILGTAVNYEVVSISADGMVCHWDLGDIARDRKDRIERDLKSNSNNDKKDNKNNNKNNDNNTNTSTSSSSRIIEPVRCNISKTIATSKSHHTSSTNHSSSSIGQSVDVGAIALAHGIGAGNAASRQLTRVYIGTSMGSLVEAALPLSEETACPTVPAHAGMVTGAAMHPYALQSVESSKTSSQAGRAVRDLLLTTSVDWTVKLWSMKEGLQMGGGGNTKSGSGSKSGGKENTSNTGGGNKMNISEPLVEFRGQSYDYVVDVRWSPLNPALFATVTSSAEVVLWDLTQSVTDDTASLNLTTTTDWLDHNNDTTTKVIKRRSARVPNRCCWTPDGRSLLIGDSEGIVTVVYVAESQAAPRAGDDNRLELALLQLKAGKVGGPINMTTNTTDTDNKELNTSITSNPGEIHVLEGSIE